MITLATITATLAGTATAIRAVRAVLNQSLLAIIAGKALWASVFKKPVFVKAFLTLKLYSSRF